MESSHSTHTLAHEPCTAASTMVPSSEMLLMFMRNSFENALDNNSNSNNSHHNNYNSFPPSCRHFAQNSPTAHQSSAPAPHHLYYPDSSCAPPAPAPENAPKYRSTTVLSWNGHWVTTKFDQQEQEQESHFCPPASTRPPPPLTKVENDSTPHTTTSNREAIYPFAATQTPMNHYPVRSVENSFCGGPSSNTLRSFSAPSMSSPYSPEFTDPQKIRLCSRSMDSLHQGPQTLGPVDSIEPFDLHPDLSSTSFSSVDSSSPSLSETPPFSASSSFDSDENEEPNEVPVQLEWLQEFEYIDLLQKAHHEVYSCTENPVKQTAGKMFFTRRSCRPWKNDSEWKNCGRKKECPQTSPQKSIVKSSRRANSSEPILSEIKDSSPVLRVYYRVHKDNPDLRKRMLVLKDNPDIVLHHITFKRRRTRAKEKRQNA